MMINVILVRIVIVVVEVCDFAVAVVVEFVQEIDKERYY
jgi:hypothetical protein